MNNLTKTSLLVILTVAAMAGIFFACEKNEPEAFVSNENSDFLQLSSNYNPSYPSMKDLGILAKGIERLPSFIDLDDLLAKTNAQDLKMSQNLFNECVSFFKPHKTRKRKVVPGEFENFDSFARTLSYILGFKRPGKNDCYAEIQSYCVSTYRTGMLNDSQIAATLDHFSYNMKITT